MSWIVADVCAVIEHTSTLDSRLESHATATINSKVGFIPLIFKREIDLSVSVVDCMTVHDWADQQRVLDYVLIVEERCRTVKQIGVIRI